METASHLKWFTKSIKGLGSTLKSLFKRKWKNWRYSNMLPQEIFAEALWLEWQYHSIQPSICKIHTLLRRYNLKPKRNTTDNDLSLIIGRALKHCRTHTSKEQIDKIAEETDRICTIARWDFAVARYAI